MINLLVYEAYDALVTDAIQKTRRMAHCDQRVLHQPGNCEYCDKYPELQNFRLREGMQFTDEEAAAHHKLPCPALVRRSQEKIERWGGNVANVTIDAELP